MTEDWLARWEQGRIGWHETGGNAGLKAHWPDFANPGNVLVPLCGKTPDLLWLENRGHEVIGVELSQIAVEEFFAEQGLSCEVETSHTLTRYSATDRALTIYCGDYFDYRAEPFDALYDRAALVALPAHLRSRYVEHTEELLKPGAFRFVVTLEYDQRIVDGPPFSVPADELKSYWKDLVRVGAKDDIDNCPPKFRQAGLQEISEVFWSSP